MWVIFGLSVVTLALILWKLWHFMRLGVWGRAPDLALKLWAGGNIAGASDSLGTQRALRKRMARAAMRHCLDPDLGPEEAREETVQHAKMLLSKANRGLRAIELVGTIAPLLGLFGTVLGMIAAFQALQEAGSRADPAALAGGIWEALLTTAAGMGVAMPAIAALTWFESQTDRLRLDLEAIATRIHTRAPSLPQQMAAE